MECFHRCSVVPTQSVFRCTCTPMETVSNAYIKKIKLAEISKLNLLLTANIQLMKKALNVNYKDVLHYSKMIFKRPI